MKRGSYEGEAAESSEVSFGYHVGRNRGARQSLPYEIQMYLLLPFLYVLMTRTSAATMGGLWIFSILLAMLQPSIIARANLAQFAPCFVSGVLGYRWLAVAENRAADGVAKGG